MIVISTPLHLLFGCPFVCPRLGARCGARRHFPQVRQDLRNPSVAQDFPSRPSCPWPGPLQAARLCQSRQAAAAV